MTFFLSKISSLATYFTDKISTAHGTISEIGDELDARDDETDRIYNLLRRVTSMTDLNLKMKFPHFPIRGRTLMKATLGSLTLFFLGAVRIVGCVAYESEKNSCDGLEKAPQLFIAIAASSFGVLTINEAFRFEVRQKLQQAETAFRSLNQISFRRMNRHALHTL